MTVHPYCQLGLSSQDTAKHLQERNRAAVAGVIAALKRNEATPTQIEGALALAGKRKPVAATVATNVRLSSYGFERMQAGLATFFSDGAPVDAHLRIYMIPSTGPRGKHWDLKKIRSVYQPTLKQEFDHFVGRFRVIADANRATIALVVLGWRRAQVQPIAPVKKPLKRRRPVQTIEPSVHDRKIDNRDLLAAAIATLWEINGNAETGPFPSGMSMAAPPVTNVHHQLDLRCFVIQAQLELPRSMFGYGLGRKLAQSVGKEIVARAESLDLTGVSPLQKANVIPFSSRLPGNANGLPCKIATISLL